MKISKARRTPEASRDWALAGLRTYGNPGEAIDAEDCNDAIHMLFPDEIEAAAREFLTGFRGTCLFAVKANPHPAVLRLLWRAGVRHFDLASLRECALVSELLPESERYFMHPVKSRQAIGFAYERGIRSFAFDSMDELTKIEEETDGADLTLYLRLQTRDKSAAYDLGGKFGASLIEAPLLLTRARRMASKLGVCFHVGSQCLEPAAFGHAITGISAMLQGAAVPLDAIDVGGGFPVAYPGMMPPPLASYFERISETLEQNGLSDLTVSCEPGRALVAKGGAVAVRVELRRGYNLYINDGTYGALFDAGVTKWPFPLSLHPWDGRKPAARQSAFSFFGPTCDSHDRMDGPFFLPDDVQEGDWVIMQHLGAYGYAMQTHFNGFQSDTTVAVGYAAEAALKDTGAAVPLMRRRRNRAPTHII